MSTWARTLPRGLARSAVFSRSGVFSRFAVLPRSALGAVALMRLGSFCLGCVCLGSPALILARLTLL